MEENGFEQVLPLVDGVQGWLTDAQARVLWERARALAPPATVVEIGSYQGRSTIVLAAAVAAGVDVVAIDPHAGNDRGPRQLSGSPAEGERDHRAFLANLARSGLEASVCHLRQTSREALPAVDGPVDLLYVDGSHRFRPASEDLRSWGGRVPPGGTLLVHDAFSSVGVTLALLGSVSFGGDWCFGGRTGSLATYRRAPLRGTARAANAGRQLAQLPWFLRNLAVKAALVVHLRPLARLLGHHDGPWPY